MARLGLQYTRLRGIFIFSCWFTFNMSLNIRDLRSNENYCSSSENKTRKFRPVWDVNQWPLRYRCSALVITLVHNKFVKCNRFEYMKIIHVNRGLRNEYVSDLCGNEHYSSSSENKPALRLVSSVGKALHYK